MLMTLFQKLERVTREPYFRLKTEIDRARAVHFDIDEIKLRPWHYGDRYFQSAPETSELKLDALFTGHMPVDLALATYDGMGLEVRDVLERSDLYPREGKNQHAFCLNLNRQGDVRTLNNLEPSLRWTTTLLHELGHAVYSKYIDRDLPWVLRIPPHMLSTEAIALMMGGLTHDKKWLTTVLGVPTAEAEQVACEAIEHERANHLIFTRWSLVMTHFERALYSDPEADLDTLWWDFVEEYQGLRCPDGRHSPDWAAKYHIALEPVYYHNYEMGLLFAAQLKNRLEEEMGEIVGSPETGSWLVNHVFYPGGTQDWAKHIETVTGEPLNPSYFVASIS
jgi:peptidyl-dipeptidase A